MATIKEVARRAKVSVGTVSNVLSGAVPVSEKLRDRVMQIIRELDYHPNHVARSLKIRQTKMLGMVVSDLTNPFFPQVVRGAEDAAWKHHYMLLTFNSDDQVERERQVLTALRTRRVDGILLVAASTDGDVSHVQGALDSGIPIVCLDRNIQALGLDSVCVDNTEGARECVDHLIASGHRRIGILTGPLALEVARDRLEGYKCALASAGIPFDEMLVREGDFRAESGYRAALSLVREQRPTAIFSSNAMMALGLLRALNESRLRCPQDVAVATFDEAAFSESVRPPLTTVAQPAYELGVKATEMLIRRIADPLRRKSNLVLKTELRVRESSVIVGSRSVAV
jgi:LacI family transcriptional regulator